MIETCSLLQFIEQLGGIERLGHETLVLVMEESAVEVECFLQIKFN